MPDATAPIPRPAHDAPAPPVPPVLPRLPPPPFIQRPAATLEAWTRHFQPQDLPVLADTAAALEAWRADEDAVDAKRLGRTIAADPLMTLKLLAHLARVRRRQGWDDSRSDAETVTEALVLLGITPFFRAFGPQPVAEHWLEDQPEALAGFQAVLQRSHRAARFAISFAAHRLDADSVVIHAAALLHDFTELLLWLRAPALALEIQRRQAADPALRSAQVQQALLNTTLPDLQHALMLAWRLPRLLTRITDDRHAEDPQVRTVLLAIRVARHSARGWHNPALPDDVREVAGLLQLGEAPAQRLLLDIDREESDADPDA